MNVVTEISNHDSIREIGVITTEIKTIVRQSRIVCLFYAVEIGKRLKEAKDFLAHGEWGEWLKNEVEFSQSSAQNFMKLYDEYGSEDFILSNSQTFVNLPYSKALQLLAIPKDERESFAEEVGAEDLSVKELKEAIKERDEAKAREKELADKFAEYKAASDDVSKKDDEIAQLRDTLATCQREYEATKANELTLSEKLKAAQKDPKISPATLKKLKTEAEAAAKKAAENDNKKAIEDLQKKLEEAQADKAAAELAASQAKQKLEVAENKLKVADPEVSAFKALLSSFQNTASELLQIIAKMRDHDSETADKLMLALKTFVSSVVDEGGC